MRIARKPAWVAPPAKRLAAGVSVALALVGATAAQGQDLGQSGAFGLWRNHKDSVWVRVEACGERACGTIVRANAKARSDASRAGSHEIIGLRIFSLEQDKRGTWRGKVFAPDLNRSFSGSARLLDASRLEAKGCLIGGILCKSQVWTRVTPDAEHS